MNFQDKRHQPIGMCLVGGLGVETYGYDRMVALAAAALADTAAELGGEEVAFVLAVPEAGRADDDQRFDVGFAHDVASRGGLRADRRRTAVVRADRAGVGHAVVRALEWLDRGAARVVVGGVDSYFHPGVLGALDDACRLHALGAEDGFVPGEAAAFFVLDVQPRHPTVTLARALVGHDASAELVPSPDAPPDIAQVMTRLLQEATPDEEACWVIHDGNGERHRSRWWSLASSRETVASAANVQRIPTLMGDVGAATGAVAVALAHALWRAASAPSPRCLVALHGENGERSVLALDGAAR